ncbi:carbohydrate ABC transporter membrane protein 2, CUT1 family [Sanguibacter gelidistatuariae]|uniref:Carbohydrate ABC transporter membrane protein 2, CUT1 family n=1 Tax=Sanguibacter gelidistatuariae TaxID=1814289 RepID=A0A1G6MT47_9MICO|nr:carbohydrate ABC transporter permease [Sanguibacter gelidistatuariae]SDC58621.1 carbohydrate ABC transporter membrane protein 2, CUT1 family [Sanguibacter gelidistatuariae]
MSAVERPAWMGKPRLSTSIVRGIALVLICLVVIFPFVVVVSTSLATQADIDANGGYVIWPASFSLDAYHQIFNGTQVTRAIIISIGITAVGTAFSLFCTVLAAYGLSRKGSLFQRGLLTFVLITLLFGPGMIPVYLMVKNLGMLNTYWALIIPGAVSAFNIIIIRGFIQGIPGEIFDAARIDGASEWKVLSKIVLPLSVAAVAVVGLFLAVGYWNNYFGPLLYLNDSNMWPLQLLMRSFVLQGNVSSTATNIPGTVPPPQQAIQMALVVIATLPILCAYPFLTKHMSKGMLTGAVKG